MLSNSDVCGTRKTSYLLTLPYNRVHQTGDIVWLVHFHGYFFVMHKQDEVIYIFSMILEPRFTRQGQ